MSVLRRLNNRYLNTLLSVCLTFTVRWACFYLHNQPFIRTHFVTSVKLNAHSLIGAWVTTVLPGYLRSALLCTQSPSCPVLSLFTVEGNGRPQDHPQCTLWIYSKFHPWRRYEVNIAVYVPTVVTLVCCEMLFMPLHAARSTMSFCLTSPEFWRTSAPSTA